VEREAAMTTFDPRITPARPDLAASHLQGRVVASRFVAGRACEVVEPQAPLRREPWPDAALATEALKGERVTVYETTDEGWCWGQLDTDGYVGWLPANALGAPTPAPTHKVAALRTVAFPGPSIKLPPREFLALGCRLCILRREGDFAVSPGGYLPARHLAPLGAREADFVAVAERFVGAPYVWGGKTSLGIDCSGLVQVALTAAGVSCPRDSDMQEQALGRPTDPGRDFAGLRRGDRLFWSGHVAIVRDAATLLHANAFHMAVAVEPVVEAVARIAAAGFALSCVRRL
jgi:cell wall-associated NlpC family hydrolase